jgi:hypothetical protein
MGGLHVVVEVAVAEAPELDRLLTDLNGDRAVARRMDGETVVQVVAALSGGGLAVLRTWLLSRVEQRKHSTVIWEGRRMVGYTADEVTAILAALEERQVSAQPPSEAAALRDETGEDPNPTKHIGADAELRGE